MLFLDFSMSSFRPFARLTLIRYLPSILLPQRISVIRTLPVNWHDFSPRNHPPLPPQDNALANCQDRDLPQGRWSTIWYNISRMQGLQNLRVNLHVFYPEHPFWQNLNPGSAKILLDPIRSVTGPKFFVLGLPFPAMDNKIVSERPSRVTQASALARL